MVKRTYGDLKAKLGRVATLNGFRTTDARLLERVNEAIEDIMESNDFPFIIDELRFTVTNGHLSLPNSVDRIVNATVDDVPIHNRSAWFEYIDSGLGKLDDDDRDFVILERGEAPTFAPVPEGGPFVLKIQAAEDEGAGATVHIRGLDDNGLMIHSAGVEGIDVPLNQTGPFETLTTQKFSKVTAFIKSKTLNSIKLFAQTSPGGVDTQIGLYEPKDTTASFRQYFIPFLQDEETHILDIRGKRRFIPIEVDNDEMAISNFMALKFMLIAHHKAETQDEGGYTTNFILAAQKMWEQSQGYRGKTKTPAVSVEMGVSIGDFPGID